MERRHLEAAITDTNGGDETREATSGGPVEGAAFVALCCALALVRPPWRQDGKPNISIIASVLVRRGIELTHGVIGISKGAEAS